MKDYEALYNIFGILYTYSWKKNQTFSPFIFVYDLYIDVCSTLITES